MGLATKEEEEEQMTKRSWINRGFSLVVAFGLLGSSTIASAGMKADTATVQIGSGYALGQIGAARASGDSSQYIGCDTVAYPGYSYVSCYAMDASFKRLNCTSTDPKVMASVASMTPFSYIQFNADSSANCSLVYISNSSYWRPQTL
jgi:hypothetical protein